MVTMNNGGKKGEPETATVGGAFIEVSCHKAGMVADMLALVTILCETCDVSDYTAAIVAAGTAALAQESGVDKDEVDRLTNRLLVMRAATFSGEPKTLAKRAVKRMYDAAEKQGLLAEKKGGES